ncbi:MAG: hypothetical protein SGJ19_02425 [Planctomycetia bacterium]|nr:hypothetical protein [Planctomycetia bacterium]
MAMTVFGTELKFGLVLGGMFLLALVVVVAVIFALLTPRRPRD